MNVALQSAAGAARSARRGAQVTRKRSLNKKKVNDDGTMRGLDLEEVEDMDHVESESDTDDTDTDGDDFSDDTVPSKLTASVKSRQASEQELSFLTEDQANDNDELVVDAVTRHTEVSKQVYQAFYNEVHSGATSSKDIKVAQGGTVAHLLDSSAKPGKLSQPSSSDQPGSSWRFWRSSHGDRSRLGIPIFHPRDNLAVAWGIIMLLVDAIYSSFVVPLAAAFCIRPGIEWCAVTEYIAGPIFLLNLVLGFHIGFVISCNLRRMYITRPNLVARFYARHGGLWLDVLAAMAFIMQILTTQFRPTLAFRVVSRLLLLFRLIRVYRLLTVMYMASVSARSGKRTSSIMGSVGLYTLTLLFTGAFFVNGFACLLYAVASIEGLPNSWLGRYANSYWPNGTPLEDLLNASPYRHWQLSVYYVTATLVTVGYGDITPATTVEQLIAICIMLSAACMFAVLISSISEALSTMTADARTGSTVRKKLAAVAQWMVDRNMPDKERKRILAFYSTTWRQHQKDYTSELQIFEELPSYLRAKVARGLLQPLLLRSVMLPSEREAGRMAPWPLQPAHVQLLAERFVPVEVMPGHDLFVEGADADTVYLLELGKLEVLQHQRVLHILDNTHPAEAREAVWIGMSSILSLYEVHSAMKRPMRVRAITSSKLWRLELESLKPVMRTQLEFVKLLMRMFKHQMLQALRSQVNARGSGVSRSHASRFTNLTRPPGPHAGGAFSSWVPNGIGSAGSASHHSGSILPDGPEAVSSLGIGTPGPDSFEWNEFHAFMRVSTHEPHADEKLESYRRWMARLEEAKPSQLMALLSDIMRESPIGSEMQSTSHLVLMANSSMRTKELAAASSTKNSIQNTP